MTGMSKDFKGAFGIGIVTLILMAETLKMPFGSLTAPGPSFMALIVEILILGICLSVIGKELFLRFKNPPATARQDAGKKPGPDNDAAKLRPWKIIGATFAYVALLDKLGFFIVTPVLVFIVLRLMEYRSRWVSLLFAVLITAVSYLIFDFWFGITLPKGIFV